MTITDATDDAPRPEVHLGAIYAHMDDPGLLAIDVPDGSRYLTLNAGQAVKLFFHDPIGMAVRLRDLAAELEALAMDGAA